MNGNSYSVSYSSAYITFIEVINSKQIILFVMLKMPLVIKKTIFPVKYKLHTIIIIHYRLK